MIPTLQLGQLGRASTQNAVPAAILSSLVHFWEFEENDGTSAFIDALGAQNLTVRNTAGTSTTAAETESSTGIVNRHFDPASVEGVTAYIPNSAGFKLPNSDWTFGAWFRAPGIGVSGSTRFIMGNIGSSATDFQAVIRIDSATDQASLFVTTTGAAGGAVNVAAGQSFDNTVWTLATATLDRVNNEIRLRMRRTDAGSITSVATAFPSALYTGSTTANFCINDGLSSDSTYFSGTRSWLNKADQAFYMTRAISDDEFNYLFNNGSGRSYAAILAGEP